MTITLSEVWVPFITRAKMSRPISSWPNGWSPIAKPLAAQPGRAGSGWASRRPATSPGVKWSNFHQPGIPKAPIEV